MTESARRVAVLGGSRIPFARQNGPYAKASNQDMLTATLDALVDRFGLIRRAGMTELDGATSTSMVAPRTGLRDKLPGE